MSKLGETILIIDDDDALLGALSKTLELAGYKALTARDAVTGAKLLKEKQIDTVLLDLQLPGVEGLEALEKLHSEHPDIPIVMITAFGNIPIAVQATRAGAFDFLQKPIDRDRLLVVVRNGCDRRRLEADRIALLHSLQDRDRIVGDSLALQELKRQIALVAPTEETILILGETGSGKELVAAAIHNQSRRSSKLFVKVNCAAIPPTLIESKLFGHRRGAFTDAKEDRPGAFKLAHTGTLFLDEIGDMDLAVQAKVLRALREGEIEPVGGDGQEKVDVRVVTATNRDLKTRVKEGYFREDLYFRINTIVLPVPALREHAEDIKPLMEHFLAEAANRNNRPLLQLRPDAVHRLMQYAWRGNVAELDSCARWLSTYVSSTEITARDVSEWMGVSVSGGISPPESGTYDEAKEQFERDYFQQLLTVHDGNISAVARAAGLDRSGLHRKLKALGLVDSSPH